MSAFFLTLSFLVVFFFVAFYIQRRHLNARNGYVALLALSLTYITMFALYRFGFLLN